ncbi:TPA: hypothetical protein DHW58_02260 [Patescibacteria group bacterium]|nr:MAG: hypothetical protein VE99_C0001G0131 [candidate division Kazan bacterium GW2011_GWC1_52_13]KKW26800.1 MAG: hypothetical protein VF00_C0002G0125 [candidate division Kazan bacterium GW2011_GWB1_52_7]HAV65795.1 hypothetical protein [Patescibacteria group bacterium]HCL47792.1 hypothetical protein [Patescibacteria group bacterium]HCR42795.1 hypothetical protein [Patescibacteria group bacterium]
MNTKPFGDGERILSQDSVQHELPEADQTELTRSAEQPILDDEDNADVAVPFVDADVVGQVYSPEATVKAMAASAIAGSRKGGDRAHELIERVFQSDLASDSGALNRVVQVLNQR